MAERIADGQFTATIYGLVGAGPWQLFDHYRVSDGTDALRIRYNTGQIKEGKHGEACAILHEQIQIFPQSRAALSLLGHCSFQMQDFETAAEWCVASCGACSDG